MIRSDAARALPDAAPLTSPGAEGGVERPSGLKPNLHVVPQPHPLRVVIVVPTLETGAADLAALDHARILAQAGHAPIVVSSGGRLEAEFAAAGVELLRLDLASANPVKMVRNAFVLARLLRQRRCDVVHAHARGAAWSAYFAARYAGVPLLTSWHKGFREQNAFKHLYNGVMARGERVIAANEQIAELIHERYGMPWSRIVVIPGSIDLARFDPTNVGDERVAAVRNAWGVKRDTKVILVIGRMLRRKGHHVVVRTVRRLKELGLKDFLCVFLGEDHGRTRYSAELWDLVLATGTSDVIRLAGTVADTPAAYAAATVVVSASIQAEGVQKSLLEAAAMARPVVASDLAAGADVVLAPPAVVEDRMTGFRVPAGDEAALAAALVRVFSLNEAGRRAIGARGRAWVLDSFDAATASERMLAVYSEVAAARKR